MKNNLVSSLKVMVLSFGMLSVVGLSSEAQAATVRACVTTKGVISVKTQCAKSEREVKVAGISNLAAAGPQGVQGVAGAQGPMGLQGVKGDRGEPGALGEKGLPGAVGAQGVAGSQGAVGPQGAVGETGSRGVSAFSELPAGTVLRGVIGADYYAAAANTEWSVSQSLSGVPPTTFSNEMVVVQNNTVVDNNCSGAPCVITEELTYTRHCTGTASAPISEPGWICIYPTSDGNAASLRGTAIPNDAGQYGFLVRWIAPNSGRTTFKAVWAYTAP